MTIKVKKFYTVVNKYGFTHMSNKWAFCDTYMNPTSASHWGKILENVHLSKNNSFSNFNFYG